MRWLWLAVCVVASACSTGSRPQAVKAPSSIGSTPRSVLGEIELRRALGSAAGYLRRHTRESGRFVYKHDSPNGSRYNLLRHAGTIYALASYRTSAEQGLDEVLRRSSQYLLDHYLRDLGEERAGKAMMSLSQETNRKYDEAKLGGTALAVVALCQVREDVGDVASQETLQALGNFIVFMQRKNGSFHSKYRPGHGYNRRFRSLLLPRRSHPGPDHAPRARW